MNTMLQRATLLIFAAATFSGAATVTDGFLDITFVGDGYSRNQIATFSSDVTRFSNYLLTYEPFHNRAAQIRFHSVINTSPLGCAYKSSSNGDVGLLMCNSKTVAKAISTSGVPTDFIVVIENSIRIGGGVSGNQVYGYNGNAFPGPGEQVFVRLIGTAVGNLLNEVDNGLSGPIDNNVHGNCYAGTPPAAPWSGMVPFAVPQPSNGSRTKYLPGCNGYSNWYRAGGSVLSGFGRPWNTSFDAPSQAMISAGMDAFTSTYADQTPPAAFIDNLSNGMSVSGDVDIQASVSDNAGIARVELWKDGVMYDAAQNPPYKFVWSTEYEAAGSHSVQVKAVDAAGNVGSSSTLQVNVIALSDSMPPSGAITWPVTGNTVDGVITVTATAADNLAVGRVELQIGLALYATDYAPPYNFTLDTRAYPNGTYFLNLRIFDTSGNLMENNTGQVVYFKN